MAIDPSRVRRFEHGSRVPGWDDAVDLTKDPAVVPDLASTPVPDELRATIEAYMAKYPSNAAPVALAKVKKCALFTSCSRLFTHQVRDLYD